jgi:hypothetical protein
MIINITIEVSDVDVQKLFNKFKTSTLINKVVYKKSDSVKKIVLNTIKESTIPLCVHDIAFKIGISKEIVSASLHLLWKDQSVQRLEVQKTDRHNEYCRFKYIIR